MTARGTDDPAEDPTTTGPFAFDVFEVVVLIDPVPQTPARGTVLGRTRGDDGLEYYAVAPDDGGQTTMASGEQLAATGEHRRREDIYDGSGIRVSRDGEVLGGQPPRTTA